MPRVKICCVRDYKSEDQVADSFVKFPSICDGLGTYDMHAPANTLIGSWQFLNTIIKNWELCKFGFRADDNDIGKNAHTR